MSPGGIQTEFQEGFSHVLVSKMLPRYSKSDIRSYLRPGLSGAGSHDLISPGLSLQIAWYLDISDGLYLDDSAAGLVKSYLRLPGILISELQT